ncbi:Kap122p NDAI_0D03590 [Naumovozyma dairenensis CBS 421]|uniref:Exportin-1/Importin-beta-like domain-containing protein n=1 Tax=Naumovozyma dairenensis (strain ATCC 10597 / BCRC 20456 / CBS 421 / NBRC 0211 / NRRL Y-12639) TaxID=1071378 RepID=G0WA62_NAUDC|nr:hypothetical protein NDAI_0D03590 [Naumovozyma dairenensis CBS 421]CCD24673.1 hypothetical protein NDAI_0D03590 [Naumovozyma dairenensis CBS 421]
MNTNTSSKEFTWKLLKANLLFLLKYGLMYANNPNQRTVLMMIIKKLMSNLSFLFNNINESGSQSEPIPNTIDTWNNPINTIIFLFSQYPNNVPNWDMVASSNQINEIFRYAIDSNIPYDQLLNFVRSSPIYNELLLTFTEIIVEDLLKLQAKRHAVTKIHKIVHEHLYITTTALIVSNLSSQQMITDDTIFASINAWINYISSIRHISSDGTMDLTEIFQKLLDLMYHSSEHTDKYLIAEKVLTIFANVFANDPLLMSFPLREQVEALFLGISRSGNGDIAQNKWMLQYMNYLVTNEMTSELKDLTVCIVDFLQINTLDVCNKLFTTISTDKFSESVSEQYIKVLLQMTNFPLVPVLQEFFSVRMVDFWLELAECYSTLSNDTLKSNANEISTDIFQQVINIYLPKISLLNEQKILQEDNDSSSLHEFDDFRKAVADLTQTLWMILGHANLTNVLIIGIGSADASTSDNIGNLYQIESMSYLLGVLLADGSDSVSPWICNVLKQNSFTIENNLLLFRHSMTKLNTNINTLDSTLSLTFARTSCALIGRLAGYFTSEPAKLSTCLEALFQGLETCTVTSGSPINGKLETIIVKTIVQLCETCRQQLSSFLEHFFNVLMSVMRPNSNVSNFTRSNLVKSVGYIIQCRVENGAQEQGKYILQLIDMIGSLIENNLNSPVLPSEQQYDYMHCLLDCILELGSSMLQSDDSENTQLLQRLPEFQQFWQNDPFYIRNKIMAMIEKALAAPEFNNRSGIIEVSCLILGRTLTVPDDEPHFLRYSMQEIINFILAHIGTCELTISLPYFVYLLEKLFKHFKDILTSEDFDFLFEKIILPGYTQYISRDPDLLQTTINLLNTILDCKPSLVIFSKHWTTFIFPELLKLLSAKERFTTIAVGKFWTKVINNKKYTQQDLQVSRQQIGAIGQDLVYQTMNGLYHTQRSDLNCYTDLIRTLVAKFPMDCKGWLIVALPQVCNKPEIHERFINKLLVTRGNRAASSVILNWWLECTSLPGY